MDFLLTGFFALESGWTAHGEPKLDPKVRARVACSKTLILGTDLEGAVKLKRFLEKEEFLPVNCEWLAVDTHIEGLMTRRMDGSLLTNREILESRERAIARNIARDLGKIDGYDLVIVIMPVARAMRVDDALLAMSLTTERCFQRSIWA